MKKVVITGVTGFIGEALAKKLLSQGVKVYGVGNKLEKLQQLCQCGDFVPVIADFAKYEYLDQMIEDRGFDTFFHFAWAGKLQGADLYDFALQNKNVDAACIACEKAIQLKTKRFVFCSSSYCEMTSADAGFPVNYYGIAKKAASDYCMAICYRHQIECNIAILTNTFGIGDRSQKAVNTFIKKFLKNEPIDLIDGDNPNDWVYIDDVISGIISIARSPKFYKRYYLGHREITTFKEKLLFMKQVLNSSSELNFGKYPDNTYVDYTHLDADIIYNDTGFECRSDFGESIRKTAEWVKSLQ